jgi:flavin-dependent dehydrogenase
VEVLNLGSLPSGTILEADLVIVGGGAAGLAIAREFFATSAQVLIVESGTLEDNPACSALNAVESVLKRVA